MALKNFFGDYFPTRDAQSMVELCGIQKNDRVLEVGGGFHQFERADVITDLTFSDSSNRNGAQMFFQKGKTYVECAVEDLPFSDGEFDFVFCSHVLEHCIDPEKAASELSRVARRGYVEMPRMYSEFVLGNPSHRWMVTQTGSKLFFEPRPFVEVPFRNFMHSHVLNDPSFDDLGRRHFHNIFNVQLVFEGRLEAEVIRRHGPKDFDYSDRVQAGISHLLFAYNNLYFQAKCEYSLCDAFEATEKLPDDPDSWHILGIYQLKLLMLNEALISFDRARELGGGSVPLDYNRDLAKQLLEKGRGDTGSVLLPGMERQREAWVGIVDGSRGGGESSSVSPSGSAERPRVSMIIVASTDDVFLEEAISSVINQSWRPLEIVIVVPGSGLSESLQKRFRLDCTLEVIEVEAGLGLVDCLNRGLTSATGEYIGFMEPTDRLGIHHVQRLADCLIHSGDKAAYSDALAMTYWRKEDGGRDFGYRNEIIVAPQFVAGKFPPENTMRFTSMMIHRHCLDVVPFLDSSLGDLAGVDLLNRVSRHGPIRHLELITGEIRRPDHQLENTTTANELDARHRKLLDNYSHFEPLELMRRVVELDNVNTSLRAEIARLKKS